MKLPTFLSGALFACAAPALATTPVPAGPGDAEIPLIEGVRIDGADSDWGARGWSIQAFADDATIVRAEKDFHVRGKLAWDRDGLLVFLDVQDDVAEEFAVSGGAYDYDSVELFVGLGGKGEKDCLQIVVSPGTSAEYPQLRYSLFNTYKHRTDGSLAQPELVRTVRSGGYTLEARIPWVDGGFSAPVAEGARVDFRCYVNDADRLGTRYRSGFPSTGRTFQAVKLGKAEAPAAEVAAWSQLDLACANVNFNVTAPVKHAGAGVSAVHEGKTLASGVFVAGLRGASATVPVPLAKLEGLSGVVQLRVGEAVLVELPAPELKKLRKEVFDRAAFRYWRSDPERDAQVAFAQPRFESAVFQGTAFPAFTFADEARTRALLGDYTISVTYYDVDGKVVTEAAKPGRYGAVAQVKFAGGGSSEFKRTLYRLAPGQAVPEDVSEVAAVQHATGCFVAKPMQTVDDTRIVLPEEAAWARIDAGRGKPERYEYLTYVPEGYEAQAGKEWPLLLYIHGSGGHRPGGGEKYIAALQEKKVPMIAVYPRIPGEPNAYTLKAVVDEVVAKYRVDRSRIYTQCFSRGGRGMFKLIVLEPDLFAAAVSTGTRGPCVEAMEAYRTTPLWGINGEDDGITYRWKTRESYKALAEAGYDAHLTLVPVIDHGATETKFSKEDAVFEWLLSHRKQQRLSPKK